MRTCLFVLHKRNHSTIERSKQTLTKNRSVSNKVSGLKGKKTRSLLSANVLLRPKGGVLAGSYTFRFPKTENVKMIPSQAGSSLLSSYTI